MLPLAGQHFVYLINYMDFNRTEQRFCSIEQNGFNLNIYFSLHLTNTDHIIWMGSIMGQMVVR